MTKTRKKLLAVLLPVGVLVLAGAIVLALWLTAKPEVEKPFLILRDPDTGQITRCELQQGLTQGEEYTDLPLPYYAFSMPEGWTHTQNGAKSADRYSTEYRDGYQDETGAEVQILQTVAQQPYTALPDQEIQFGDIQILYYGSPLPDSYLAGHYTIARWVYGDSLDSELLQPEDGPGPDGGAGKPHGLQHLGGAHLLPSGAVHSRPPRPQFGARGGPRLLDQRPPSATSAGGAVLPAPSPGRVYLHRQRFVSRLHQRSVLFQRHLSE